MIPMRSERRNRAILPGQIGLILVLLALVLWSMGAFAAEVIPPPPKTYFYDGAGVTRPETAQRLNRELEQFERDTSNQIVVAVYPRMRSDSSIEDYTVRVAQAWHVGQKGRDNGAVLFVFVKERKMYIQVGYGLEGVLTDFLCNQIINNEIKPRLRAGDFDGGLASGVHAMIAATKGEYKGTGRTVAENRSEASGENISGWVVVLFFIALWLLSRLLGHLPGSRGPGSHGRMGGGPILFTGGGSSEFSGGGGGGGFSGGGGGFGGGGAGGDW